MEIKPRRGELVRRLVRHNFDEGRSISVEADLCAVAFTAEAEAPKGRQLVRRSIFAKAEQ